MAPPNKCLLSDNASNSFENTCLGPVGHWVSALGFAAAAVAQKDRRSYYCLERLAPMQNLLISLMSLEISQMVLHLILRPSFLSGQQAVYGIDLLRPCQLIISSPRYRTCPSLLVSQACLLFKLVHLSSLSPFSKPSCRYNRKPDRSHWIS